jgi:secondary thiamine-phosphate synthase enzyme
MPAHVKASLMGSSLTIPVGDGKLLLGTWQGVYLCEHRDRGDSRRVVLTLYGRERPAP